LWPPMLRVVITLALLKGDSLSSKHPCWCDAPACHEFPGAPPLRCPIQHILPASTRALQARPRGIWGRGGGRSNLLEARERMIGALQTQDACPPRLLSGQHLSPRHNQRKSASDHPGRCRHALADRHSEEYWQGCGREGFRAEGGHMCSSVRGREIDGVSGQDQPGEEVVHGAVMRLLAWLSDRRSRSRLRASGLRSKGPDVSPPHCHVGPQPPCGLRQLFQLAQSDSTLEQPDADPQA